MPRAAILAFDGCYASSVAGFADILQIANSHLRLDRAPASALFDWRFVSPSGETAMASNGLPLPTHKLGPRERYDLVFVPSFHYGGHRQFDQFLERQADACAWLTAQWRAGAWVAANCTGTFILAQTGLLDGRTATTTWWMERQFRAKFPRVDLQLRPVVTEMDRLICAGASASYLIQTVYIVERFAGPAIASQCAKAMLIDVSQTSQIPYLPLLAQKNPTLAARQYDEGPQDHRACRRACGQRQNADPALSQRAGPNATRLPSGSSPGGSARAAGDQFAQR